MSIGMRESGLSRHIRAGVQGSWALGIYRAQEVSQPPTMD